MTTITPINDALGTVNFMQALLALFLGLHLNDHVLTLQLEKLALFVQKLRQRSMKCNHLIIIQLYYATDMIKTLLYIANTK